MHANAMPYKIPPSHARKYVLSAVLRWQCWQRLSMSNNRQEHTMPKPNPMNADDTTIWYIVRCMPEMTIADTANTPKPIVGMCFHSLILGKHNVVVAHIKPKSSGVKKTALWLKYMMMPKIMAEAERPTNTFHPRNKKNLSVETIFVHSSGALKGNFVVATNSVAIITNVVAIV